MYKSIISRENFNIETRRVSPNQPQASDKAIRRNLNNKQKIKFPNNMISLIRVNFSFHEEKDIRMMIPKLIHKLVEENLSDKRP